MSLMTISNFCTFWLNVLTLKNAWLKKEVISQIYVLFFEEKVAESRNCLQLQNEKLKHILHGENEQE